MVKAKMIEKYYDKHVTHIIFEYRGHKYEVDYANDYTYLVTAPKIQHEIEQKKIDRMIELEKNRKEYRCEDTADYGLNMFFNETEI